MAYQVKHHNQCRQVYNGYHDPSTKCREAPRSFSTRFSLKKKELTEKRDVSLGRDIKVEEGEEVQASEAASITEKVQIHCLIMSSRECPGLKFPMQFHLSTSSFSLIPMWIESNITTSVSNLVFF
jgi:hypothetical protein